MLADRKTSDAFFSPSGETGAPCCRQFARTFRSRFPGCRGRHGRAALSRAAGSLMLVLARVCASTLLDDHRAVQAVAAVGAGRQVAADHHRAGRDAAVADLAGGAVEILVLWPMNTPIEMTEFSSTITPFDHLAARADEAVVLDDGRVGLQRFRARRRCRRRRTGARSCRSARRSRRWPRCRPWCLRRRRRRCSRSWASAPRSWR